MSNRGDSVWAAPTEAALSAERELAAAAEAFGEAVRSILRTWEEGVNSDVLGPLRQLTLELDQRHERHSAGLADSVGRAETAAAAWWSVCAYVDATHDSCLEPLAAFWEEIDPLAALEEQRAETRRLLLEAAAELPDSVRIPLTADLFDAQPGDGVFRRLGKTARRSRRASQEIMRRFGNAVRRESESLHHPTRTVMAVEAARARLVSEVFTALDEAHKTARAFLIEEGRRLERSVWQWTTDGLRHLSETDCPAFHMPTGLRIIPRGDGAAVPDTWPTPEFQSGLALKSTAQMGASHPDVSECLLRFRNDLEVAGTFIYRAPASGYTRDTRQAEAAPYARDRLRLSCAMVELGRNVRTLTDDLLEDVARSALAPMERTYDAIKVRLRDIQEEALALVKARSDASTHPRTQYDLADELDKLLVRSASLENVYRDLPGLSAADRALTEPGARAWRTLMKRVAGLPDELMLRAVVGEQPRSYRADLRQTARTAFERPIAPRLTSTAEPLRRAINRVWNQTEMVRDVVDNSFHTAIQSLRNDAAEEESEIMAEAPTDAETGELLENGLRRAAESLEERYQSLGDEWADFVAHLHRVMGADWDSALRTVQSDDFLAQQLLSIQKVIARRSERAWKRTTDLWSQTSSRTQAMFRLVRTRAKDLIRIGQSAVGVSTGDSEERHRALDTVASARALYADLPLVYRRLFSPEPITDPGLAENREKDLEVATEFVERWRAGLGPGILVIHAPLGSGRTSFLRLLDTRIKEDLRTLRVQFDRRPSSEEDVASRLAAVLYPDSGFAGTLDELEPIVRRQEKPKSALVMLDNLELLLFQAPGGTEILRRLLLFCIRTDDLLAWCGSSGSLAWEFALKTAPHASRLAISHALAPWTVGAVEELILRRHRRSGIPIQYEPPAEPSPLIGQRLRRAKTEQAAQRILASELFDGVFRAAGQSPTRALFEWVRAGDLGPSGDHLTVRPFKPLSFSYLQQFENDIAFTLRHFLFHNVLTVEEHARLFRTDMSGAIMAFETLLSEGLIEPLDPVDGATIVAGCRYRLRRLVLEPIVRSLKERHFVY